MIDKLKKTLLTGLLSRKATKLDSKIIVFESDDWGGIRTPSRKAVSQLTDKVGMNDHSVYNKFDTLEKGEDIETLINVLGKFKDKRGNYPKITANFVTANPDFDKIEKSDFSQYHYEPFENAYKQYYPNSSVTDKLNEAIDNSFFLPQFHGREHVNTNLWLEMLQKKDPIILEAFKLGFWGVQSPILQATKKTLQATFDRIDKDFEADVYRNINEGVAIFHDYFGFKPESFIPNNYIWDTKYNSMLMDAGINTEQKEYS